MKERIVKIFAEFRNGCRIVLDAGPVHAGYRCTTVNAKAVPLPVPARALLACDGFGGG